MDAILDELAKSLTTYLEGPWIVAWINCDIRSAATRVQGRYRVSDGAPEQRVRVDMRSAFDATESLLEMLKAAGKPAPTGYLFELYPDGTRDMQLRYE